MAVQSDPIRERREQYARYCHHIDSEPAANTHFHHVVKPIFTMPRIARTKLSPGFLFRDEDLVRDGDDSVSLVIAHSPRLGILHRGRDLQLDAGDATIMRADAPGRCGSRESFVVSEIMIPSAEREGRGGRPGRTRFGDTPKGVRARARMGARRTVISEVRIARHRAQIDGATRAKGSTGQRAPRSKRAQFGR
jgi:hypothetical protein